MKTKLLVWAVISLLPKILSAKIIVLPTAIGQPGDPPIQRNTLLLPSSELHKSKIETGILLDAGELSLQILKSIPVVLPIVPFLRPNKLNLLIHRKKLYLKILKIKK